MVLAKTLESLLDCKESKPVNPKGNQPWIFIRRTDAEAEAPILWPLDGKNRIIGKDPDPGKDWREELKWMTGDEMVEGYHWFNGPEFELTLGDSEGQRSLVCCSSWGHIESDTTERLNKWRKSKCDGKTCSEQSCGANGTDRLAWCRVATNLQFVENVISSKCNKRSTTKWAMPVSFHFI